jgi:hypothetical protein
LEQPVRQGGFAVVNVGDDAKIANMVRVYHRQGASITDFKGCKNGARGFRPHHPD